MGMLLGPDGRPVPESLLRRPLPPSDRQHWRDDDSIPVPTPARYASMLCDRDGQEWIEFASRLETDPHYGSVLSVRRRAVSGLDPQIHAASKSADDVRMADKCRQMLKELEFARLANDLLDGLSAGYSAVRIDWDTASGEWTPLRTLWREPQYFRWDRGFAFAAPVTGTRRGTVDDPILRHRTATDALGPVLEPWRWILFVPRLRAGRPGQCGLAEPVAWAWIGKHWTWTDWLQFVEIYGMPARLGKYGPEATRGERDSLLRAVRMLGSDAAAIIPEKMAVELLTVDRGDPVYKELLTYVDEQISKAVLGQTMTTDDGSSRAQAQVHDEVRQDIRESDARELAGVLQAQLINPYVALNWGIPANGYPLLRIPVPRRAASKDLAEALGTLIPLGLRVDQAEVRERLGLTDPRDDAELLSTPSGAAAASRLALAAAGDDVLDELDDMALEELRDWEELMDPVLDPVREALAGAHSWEDFAAALKSDDLSSRMDSRKMVERLARLAFRARGVGDAVD